MRVELTGIDRHGIVHRTLRPGDQRPRCGIQVLLDKLGDLGDDRVTCPTCATTPRGT